MSDLADRYRREGMADAVILLVAKRIHPHTTAEEWGRALGLQQHEVRAALDRLRERHARPVLLRSVDGRRHGNAGRKMLSLEQRRARDAQIVRLRELDGLSVPAIAAQVGLTTTMVNKILSRAG